MLRGLLRDILSIWLAYEILRSWIFGTQLSAIAIALAVVLFGIAIWFILERIGLLPKL
jgi:hypothetical protein